MFSPFVSHEHFELLPKYYKLELAFAVSIQQFFPFASSFCDLVMLCVQGWGIEPFQETHRDTHTFSRRVGDLPTQRENDTFDYRPVLHRDGTVFSAVSVSDLAKPEQLYRKLGAKLVVGMPFKDIATSDSIYMREIPSSADTEGRRALKRLQEVMNGDELVV